MYYIFNCCRHRQLPKDKFLVNSVICLCCVFKPSGDNCHPVWILVCFLNAIFASCFLRCQHIISDPSRCVLDFMFTSTRSGAFGHGIFIILTMSAWQCTPVSSCGQRKVLSSVNSIPHEATYILLTSIVMLRG